MRTTRIPMLAAALLALGMAGLGAAHPVHAAGITYYVALGGAGTCATGHASATSLGSVQGALNCAAQDNPPASNPDTIQIAAGTYSGPLSVNANVNLVAPKGAIVEPETTGTVITVNYGYTVGISNLTIKDGSAYDGGGIYNNGTMTLRNSTISGNSASDGGGGIFNTGAMTVSTSTITGNSGDTGGGSGGGGIFNSGTMTLSNSTVSSNTGEYNGGITNYGTMTLTNSAISDNSAHAWVIYNSGTMTLTNSTVSGNSAQYFGGIFNTFTGTMTLTNSTVKGNTSTFGPGSGIYNQFGSLTLTNSTVSKNTPTTNQCYGC